MKLKTTDESNDLTTLINESNDLNTLINNSNYSIECEHNINDAGICIKC